MPSVEALLRRPVAVAMFTLLLVFLGWLAFLSRPVDLLPQLAVPSLAVTTWYPNANPEKVAQDVTAPLEAELGALPGLKELRSVSGNDESLVILEFGWDVSPDAVSPLVRERIRSVKLPRGAYPPSVQRWDAAALPVFRFDLSGPQGADELRRLAKEKLVPLIERLPGVGTVKVYGGADREVRVEVSPARLAGYGLPLEAVPAALARQNVRARVGGAGEGGRRVSLTVDGRFGSVEEIGWTVLRAGPGGTVRVRDVAAVREARGEAREHARLDGRDSVAVSVSKAGGANTLAMIGRVKETLERARGELPPGAAIAVSRDDSGFIKEAQSLVTDGVVLGSLCTMLVVFLFLRDWRGTLTVCLTIPVCLAACFVPMWYFGVGRNILSLAGLALASGMVVDASTVMVDNIQRHRENGRSLFDACLSGSAEVKASILASALSSIVVFLPLLWTGGFAGALFRDLSLTVAGAMACSLLVVFTMIPVLYYKLSEGAPAAGAPAAASRFLAAADRAGAGLAALAERGLRWQLGSLRRQGAVCAGALLACAAAAALAPATGFIPAKYVGELRVEIQNPPGQTPAESLEKLKAAEALLAGRPGVAGWSSSVSGGLSEIFVRLSPGTGPEEADALAAGLRAGTARVPGLRAGVFKVDKVSAAVGLGKLLEFKVWGEDGPSAEAAAALAHKALAAEPALVNLSLEEEAGPEGLRLDVDRERAQAAGFSAASISRLVAALLYGAEATRYEPGRLEVRVAGAPGEREDLASLQAVPPRGGAAARLSSLAAFGRESTLKRLERFDKKRAITLSADAAPEKPLGAAVDEARAALARSAPGVSYRLMGVASCLAESVADIRFALLVSLALVYMIMAAQFESLLYPLVILAAAPLASVGVIGGLRLAGEALTLPALLGVVMLLGLLVNSGIVIVSFINMERGRGADLEEAVLLTVRARLKPIAMTTLTTVLGMLPLALGVGAGAELYQGMAVAVIGGLLASTLLSVFVVPALYVLLEEGASRLSLLRLRLFRRPSAEALQ